MDEQGFGADLQAARPVPRMWVKEKEKAATQM